MSAQKQYTVSGVSSGAYMAVQFHVAHSSVVTGVAAIAGGPYYCAQGSVWTAYYNCMAPGWLAPLPSVARLKKEAERFAAAGRIDPTANLTSARVWLFSGTEDQTVTPAVVGALRGFYGQYKVPAVLVDNKPAGHGMVTQDSGNACSATAAPYINDCDYDAAGVLLQHLLGALSAPAAAQSGRLLAFDQAPFGSHAIGMAEEGYAYLPQDCEAARCRVHVAFHGCHQSAQDVGERFVRDAGYNRWAEANRLIVLYPQAVKRYWGIYNPRGCWDWWGYTGEDYPTQEGAQIRAVKAMLDRLSAPRQ